MNPGIFEFQSMMTSVVNGISGSLLTAVQSVAYILMTICLRTLLFPLTVYEGFVREHAYGLATQTFRSWLGDELKTLALGMVGGGVFAVAIYGALRRAGPSCNNPGSR